jgi:hypothetical protein
MLTDAAKQIERLSKATGSGLSELKALLELCRIETDALPYFYSRPSGRLAEIRTPQSACARIFRHEYKGGGELLLTATPLDSDWLTRLDLYPSNEAARLALAEELATLLAVNESIIFSKPGYDHHAAIHRSGKYPASFQFTCFDRRGFISDHEVAALGEGLLEAARMGFTTHAPGLLDELVLTEEFIIGNERASIINGSISPRHLHTASIMTLRRLAPHEFEDYLLRVSNEDAGSPARLEGLLLRWNVWIEDNPPPVHGETPAYAVANRAALEAYLALLNQTLITGSSQIQLPGERRAF